MTKRLLALIMALLMLGVLFVSCSSEEPPAETTAAAETEPETEPETTTKVTTIRETKPPKVYTYETVFKIDFSKMEDGATVPFSGSNWVKDLRIEGGRVKGTSTGNDPFITYKGGDCNLEADKVQEIRIKMKNNSQNTSFQFFFTTETVSWSEPASMKAALLWSAADGDKNKDNDVVVYTFDSTEWKGTITNFRIDPFTGEGDFEIEYIEFVSKTEVKQ